MKLKFRLSLREIISPLLLTNSKLIQFRNITHSYHHLHILFSFRNRLFVNFYEREREKKKFHVTPLLFVSFEPQRYDTESNEYDIFLSMAFEFTQHFSHAILRRETINQISTNDIPFKEFFFRCENITSFQQKR